MSAQPELSELTRRLEQVENALADAQGRLPGLRAEVRAIGQALDELGGYRAVEAPACGSPAAS
ncbi:MAG: hypothetical protein ACRDNK_16725 [Solirubrobacteraceae bacterium]